MEDITLKQAIQTAIKAEDIGIKFYSELARRFAGHDELKTTFELLAKDEVEHKNQFNTLLKQVPGSYNADQTDVDFLKALDVSKYFDDMETINTSLKPIDVLVKAYQFEKDSVLFYLGIKDILGPSMLLEEIIKIEKGHMMKLLGYTLDDSKFRGILDEWK